MNIIAILVLFGLPWLISKYSTRVKLIDWLGPVVCCYAVGIIFGNVLGSDWPTKVSTEVSEISIMIALPMLLFSTNLLGWFRLARTTILSFALVCLSVCFMALLAGKIFQGYSDEVWKMAGMMVGVYTGGTPNLTAIGKALEVRDETFIILNAVDVVMGGLYLLFIMSVGIKLLTKILPAFKSTGAEIQEAGHEAGWERLNPKTKLIRFFQQILLSGICVGLAVGLTLLTVGSMSVSVIILLLTSFAIVVSFIPKLRSLEGSQEWGNYFLLVFCVAIGSLANLSNIAAASWWYFAFMGLVMLGAIFFHILCCFFLKIDRDTAIITSIAGIFGPAFVPVMAQALKNREMLVSGVTTGLVGYAVGNFLGIGVAYLLK
ncbi:MAG: DUF819 family protein [Bacteriovoracaceae bacterium]